MKTNLIVFAFFALLAYQSLSYSLEGKWTVKSQYLPTNVTSTLTFSKQINQTTSHIAYYLTISACRTLQYKYIVVDNEIYLTFDEYTSQQYECQSNEISHLRNKIEKVFFFYIVNTELALYGANGEAQLQLSRVVENGRTLVGEWLTVDVDGEGLVEAVSVSETVFEMCDGKGVVEYVLSAASKADIDFKVKKVSGCSQNQIFSTLYKSSYYRWKGSAIYLYNDAYEQIMTMRKIGEKVSTSASTSTLTTSNSSSNISSNTNSSSTATTTEVKNTTTSTNTTNTTTLSGHTTTNNSNSNSSVKNTTASTNSSATATQNTSNSNKTTDNSSKAPSTTNATNTTSNTTQSSATTSTTKPATSTGNTTTNTTTTSSTSSQTIKKYTSPSDLPTITSSQILGKWLIKDPSYDFTKQGYFFLILADKIMLYGGCNVHFSPYSLSATTNGSLEKINLQSTSKTCPDLSQALKTLIANFKMWKYVALTENSGKPTLQIMSKDFVSLTTLEKV